MAVTIKDIAAKIGCSPSTVSRALHDHPQINKKTKEAIHAMAKEMNYQVNLVAAGLRSRKTYCIGVVVPQIGNYFFSSALSGIQEVASNSNYQVLICQTNESVEDEQRYIRSMAAGRVDGLLVSISLNTTDFGHIKEVIDQGMPVVLFDRVNYDLKVPKIEASDQLGAFKAVEHLIQKGCKKIAHLAGPKRLMNSVLRQKGYREALETNGISFEESLVYDCDFDEGKARDAVKKMIKDHPDIDGVFGVNDELGVQAILTLRDMGIDVPNQVAVVGFGNYPISEIVQPPLTTMSHNPKGIGFSAMETLMNLINDEQAKVSKEPIAPQMFLRESSNR